MKIPTPSHLLLHLAIATATIGIGFMLLSNSSSRHVRPELPMMQSFSATPRFESHTEIFGEHIRLDRWDMHERYERELTNFCYTHNSTLLTIKRANRFFPILAPILKAEGIPADFIYLCCIESSLNQRALSPAKAAGLWQFMPETARQYGLQVDSEVDERYNTIKATQAACTYFKDAYKRFGNWMAVVASYNAGQGGIQRRLNEQQQNSVFDILMAEETSRYIFRIMACKEIMSNPYHYGFVIYSDQLYRPIRTREVKVDRSIPNIAEWAISQHSSYHQVKEFNPWLRDNKLTIRPGRTYTILIPETDDMYYDRKPFAIYDRAWIVDK